MSGAISRWLSDAGFTNQLHSLEELTSSSRGKVNISKCFSFSCCGDSNVGAYKETESKRCPDCNQDLYVFSVTEKKRDDLRAQYNRKNKR